MRNGTVLIDQVSGLKLVVVDVGLPAFDPKPNEILFQDRQLSIEAATPAGKAQTNVSITCDPGDRNGGGT